MNQLPIRTAALDNSVATFAWLSPCRWPAASPDAGCCPLTCGTDAIDRYVRLAIALPLACCIAGCGLLPADVRDGCYRFDDGVPLFKIVGKRGFLLSKGSVQSFRVGGWHELSRKSVEITPAFYLGGPRRGDALPIPSIAYATFPYDPQRNTLKVPVAAWGEDEVKLGRPC